MTIQAEILQNTEGHDENLRNRVINGASGQQFNNKFWKFLFF